MEINKKDIKKLPSALVNRVNQLLLTDIYAVSKPLNIDKDVRSVRLNDQYRLLFRQSTRLIGRVVSHNDYNKLISHKYIHCIQ